KKHQRNKFTSDPYFVVAGFLGVDVQLIGGYGTLITIQNELAFVFRVAVHIAELATVVASAVPTGKPPAPLSPWKAHMRRPQEHCIRSDSVRSARYSTRPPVGTHETNDQQGPYHRHRIDRFFK